MDERPKLPHYDPGRVTKLAGSVCAGILVADLMAAMLITPVSAKCSGSITGGGRNEGAYGLLLMSALAAAWMGYLATRSKKHTILFSQVSIG